MATRRRGAADLDDLKARLGLPEAGAPLTPAAESPREESGPVQPVGDNAFAGEVDSNFDEVVSHPAPAVPTPAAATPAIPAAPVSRPMPSVPGLAPAAPSAPAAPTPAAPAAAAAPARPVVSAADDFEDYAKAVAAPEANEIQLEAVTGGEEKLLGSKLPIGLIVSSLACLALGLGFGLMAGSANSAREFHNAKISGAEIVTGSVEPVANALAQLNAAVGALDAEQRYVPDFDTRLREAYSASRPIVDPGSLASASTRMLIAGDATLASRLIGYAVNTQRLGELVDSHLRLTERDRAEIERELAGAEDTRLIGVAFDFNGLVAAYNASFENPEAAWTAPGGERVFVTSPTPQLRGEGEAATLVYEVTGSAGQTLTVPITDLILVPRAQMLPAVSSETALSRYRARAGVIKETLQQIVQTQGALVEGLREAGATPKLSTF